MILILIAFLFSALLAAFFVSVMVAVGWRDKYVSAMKAANRNAGYWAEAQCKVKIGELEARDWKTLAECEAKRADELSRIAKEALKIAHHKEFSPSPEDFQSAQRLLGQTGVPPEEWPEVFD